jgi:hypothetical protein
MVATTPPSTALDPFNLAELAGSRIAELTGVELHDVAVTMGSGWGKAADFLGEVTAAVSNVFPPARPRGRLCDRG